jgi:hypothetical protein
VRLKKSRQPLRWSDRRFLQQNRHTNDIADPPTWQRMQVYPDPMLGSEKSARMINSSGEEFFNQQQDDPLAYGPYTVQLKALAKEVHAGAVAAAIC